jgi:hypothetical protein
VPSVVCPEAGEAVSLEFLANAQRIRVRFAGALVNDIVACADPEQGLHMMTDFISQHVGLGEIPGCVEAPMQFVEKIQVEIVLLIASVGVRSCNCAF